MAACDRIAHAESPQGGAHILRVEREADLGPQRARGSGQPFATGRELHVRIGEVEPAHLPCRRVAGPHVGRRDVEPAEFHVAEFEVLDFDLERRQATGRRTQDVDDVRLPVVGNVELRQPRGHQSKPRAAGAAFRAWAPADIAGRAIGDHVRVVAAGVSAGRAQRHVAKAAVVQDQLGRTQGNMVESHLAFGGSGRARRGRFRADAEPVGPGFHVDARQGDEYQQAAFGQIGRLVQRDDTARELHAGIGLATLDVHTEQRDLR